MNKGLTIAAIAAFALGAAACHKSDAGADTANVSAEDNMLVPADENAMIDANDMTATDNMTVDNSATAGSDTNAM